MKPIVILLLISFSLSGYGQAQWSGWQTIYEEGSPSHPTRVQISFKLSVCNGEYLRGYSFFRTNNEFDREKAWVKFKFDYLDCEGQTQTEHWQVNLANSGIDDDMGLWFLGHRVLRIYDVKYEDYQSKSSGNTSSGSSSGKSGNNNGSNQISYDDSSPSTRGAEQTPEKLRAQYVAKVDEANSLFNEQQYESAQQAYREAARLQPTGSYNGIIQTRLNDIERIQKQAKEKAEREAQAEAGRKAQEQQQAKEEADRKAEEQRQKNLETYRQDRQEAFEETKKAQQEAVAATAAATVATGAAVAGLIDMGISSNTDRNFYRGHSWHVGLSAGLDYTHLSMNTHQQTLMYSYNGNRRNDQYQHEAIDAEGIDGLGLTGGLTLSPLLSEFVGVEGFVQGTYGVSPVLLIGGGTTTETDYGTLTSSTSLTYTKVDYGAQASLGFKPIKLLGEYRLSQRSFDYVYSSVSDTDYGNSITTMEVNNTGSLQYQESKTGLGVRLLSYSGGFTIDFLYARVQPMLQRKALKPIPLYQVNLWWQSRCKVSLECSPGYYALGNTAAQMGNDKKWYVGVSVQYGKDFFGKSYFRK